MTGTDKCKVSPWRGTQMQYITKSWLKEFIKNPLLNVRFPDEYHYARTRFSKEELNQIEKEIMEQEEKREIMERIANINRRNPILVMGDLAPIQSEAKAARKKSPEKEKTSETKSRKPKDPNAEFKKVISGNERMLDLPL